MPSKRPVSTPKQTAAPNPKPEFARPAVDKAPAKQDAAAIEKPVADAVKNAQSAAKNSEATARTVVEKSSNVIEQATETIAHSAKIAAGQAAAMHKEPSVMATATEKTVNKTQAVFSDMNDRAKATMEKNAKMVEEMNDFAKGNVEAVVEASRITAKGIETLGQEAAEYSRKSFENATATFKNMASVKSPTELFKLQSDFMRSAFDSYVAEASKQTEAVLKLAGEAAQPLSTRFAVAADKVKTAA